MSLELQRHEGIAQRAQTEGQIHKNKKLLKKRRKIKKSEEIWLQTQNLRRFPGFAVAVVTLFDEILGMCVFRKKINIQFGCLTVFRRNVTSSIGRETKSHIYI